MKKVRKIASIVFICVLAACTRGAATQVEPRAELVMPSDARDVKVSSEGKDVSFMLRQPYPADELLADLRNRYHPPDWQQVDELLLFPGRRTSEFPAGWSEYSEKDQIVRMWIANWRAVTGATVTYIVRYRWPRERRLDESASAEVQAIVSAPKN